MEFALLISLHALRSPETQRMSSRLFTLTSSFFISGRSALEQDTLDHPWLDDNLWRPILRLSAVGSPLPILYRKSAQEKTIERFCVASSIF